MANYAYYALHKLHIRPAEFNDMDRPEKAFVIAAIQLKIREEKRLKDKRK